MGSCYCFTLNLLELRAICLSIHLEISYTVLSVFSRSLSFLLSRRIISHPCLCLSVIFSLPRLTRARRLSFLILFSPYVIRRPIFDARGLFTRFHIISFFLPRLAGLLNSQKLLKLPCPNVYLA